MYAEFKNVPHNAEWVKDRVYKVVLTRQLLESLHVLVMTDGDRCSHLKFLHPESHK